MAKSNAVWGIDIGQCALKALRCTLNDDSDKITADAFDFIEYPKILSQPEADPVELVRDALKQFLARNKVRGDRVAISVPGQSGLARFIKLPPVEAKKIPDIVRYEARQQIPFALEDVVWDYQQMAGGSESDGFALETEVGLFAMKREQVFRYLKPFTEAGIEVDIIQLSPLTIYNFVIFDQMRDLPPLDSIDPSDPPPSTIVVSLGTDTTDLVITNGYRVWQRNIPLGGNHFTKALTKELKLTFAKAEHLKRNALKAEDPKAVFLAMRPVFNDLVQEVQRSISFFQSVDRTAKIGRVVTLGNAMKLRGLQKFLAQSLGYEVVELEEYRGLSGASVIGTPAFKENLLSFGVCYGLALQALKKSALKTNLIPPEIVQDRLVRAKKPWMVAAVATVLLGCTVGFVGAWHAWNSDREGDDKLTSALASAQNIETQSSTFKTQFDTAKADFGKVQDIGDRLRDIGARRLLWPELLKAISEALPHDAEPRPVLLNPTPDQLRDMLMQSKRIEIDSLDCEHFTKLEDWFADVKDKWLEGQPADVAAAAAAGAAAPPAAAGAQPAGAPGTPDASSANPATGPTGDGWVIQIKGHHYHNQDPGNEGPQYVRKTLLKNLEQMSILLPGPDGKTPTSVKLKDLGIGYPVLVRGSRPDEESIPLPGAGQDHGPGGGPGGDGGKAGDAKAVAVPRCDFILQFIWKETTLYDRLQPKVPKAESPPALGSRPENMPR